MENNMNSGYTSPNNDHLPSNIDPYFAPKVNRYKRRNTPINPQLCIDLFGVKKEKSNQNTIST